MKLFALLAVGAACIIAAGCSGKPNTLPSPAPTTIQNSLTSNTNSLSALAGMPLQQRKAYLTAHPEIMQSIRSSPDMRQRMELVKLMSQP